MKLKIPLYSEPPTPQTPWDTVKNYRFLDNLSQSFSVITSRARSPFSPVGEGNHFANDFAASPNCNVFKFYVVEFDNISPTIIIIDVAANIKVKIYRSINFPVILYRCKTWFLTLRKVHRLRISEKGFLRRILGPKRDDIKGGWRKFYNKLRRFYPSPKIIRMIK
jgi:hypothetical protein